MCNDARCGVDKAARVERVLHSPQPSSRQREDWGEKALPGVCGAVLQPAARAMCPEAWSGL